MTNYLNVSAYNNGTCTGSGTGCYQCVDYVKRFYSSLGYTIGSWGYASNYYDRNTNGVLSRYPQGGSIPPAPGDILCFDDNCEIQPDGTVRCVGNSYGHVAIVTEVTDSLIRIIEQNWSSRYATRPLTLTVTQGNYILDESANYPIQGWRSLDVGRFVPGGHWNNNYSQAFLDAYQFHGGFDRLGRPFDSLGDGQYVHDWLGVTIQDFQGDYWGDDDQTALIYNDLPGYERAFLLKEGFWCVYRGELTTTCGMVYGTTIWGPIDLGLPLCNEFTGTDFLTYQIFEYGKLQFHPTTEEVQVFWGDFSGELAHIVEAAGGYDPDEDDSEPPQDPQIEPGPLAPTLAQVCTDIYDSGSTATCLGETSYFTVTDSDVCVHLLAKFENVYDPMHLRWELFGGYAYSDFADFWVSDSGPLYVWLPQCFPHGCSNCLSYNGPWSVRLKAEYDGSWHYLATYYFELDYLGCPASDCQIGMHRPALVFTDEIIQRKVTPIRAVHMTELRDYINLLRIDYGLSRYYWTDDPIVRKVTPIKAIHWKELRWSIEGVYQQMGIPGPYWREAINPNVPIRGQHLDEIRDALRLVW